MVAAVDFLALLGQLAQNQPDIKLLNIYKGLPISYDARISTVGDDEILVRSNPYQLACLYHQRETFLQGDSLPFIVRSQVISLNLSKEEAVLSNFEIAKNSIGNRGQIRVEPDEPLMATIQFPGSSAQILAPMADISTEGGSVYFDIAVFPARLFQPGNEINLTVSLPDTISQKNKKSLSRPLLESRDTKSFIHTSTSGRPESEVALTARGKVVSIRPEFQLKRYRVGIKLYFRDLARMVILQYISQRQIEIIRDLRILWDDMNQRKS